MQTLMSPEIGYKMLDVRSLYEVNLGKITGSVHVPLINAKKAGFLPGGRVALEQSANKNFLEDVKAKFPTKSTPMLVFCSDGFDRSIQALILLEKAGYTNIVGVKYGYNGWCNKFTNKLKRRRSDGYKEDYSGEGNQKQMSPSLDNGPYLCCRLLRLDCDLPSSCIFAGRVVSNM